MQTINAVIDGRTIVLGNAQVLLNDHNVCEIKFAWPLGAESLSKVVHVLLPSGYKFSKLLDDDTLEITREMTAQSGKMLFNVSFIDADVEKWSTLDAVLDIFARVDATGEELARTEPTVIDDLVTKDADHEQRIVTLETTGGGGTGGTTDHSKLINRELAKQHPMSAIDGLQAALDAKQSAGAYLTAETDPTVAPWAKQPSKPSYTATEVGALPANTAIPSKTSDLTNDSGFISAESTDTKIATHNANAGAHPFITDELAAINTVLSGKQDAGEYLTSESDPTVPAWAKEATKPSYSAAEVGADASGTAASAVSSHNSSGTAHSDIRSTLSTKADLVDGTVPANQLPSYVDDVLEYANLAAFPTTGVSGKIYVALDTNLTYRWSGTTYVEISASLALGETAATAYRGDRGKTAYDHSQTAHAPADAEKNVQGDWSVSDNASDAYIANKPTIPTNNNQLVNGAGYIASVSAAPDFWRGTQGDYDALTTAQKSAIVLAVVV